MPVKEDRRLTAAKNIAAMLKAELVGKKIVDVVVGDVADEPCAVLVLSDGTRLTPSRDVEGNGPGTLFVDARATTAQRHDPTETTRRSMLANGEPQAELEATPADERMTTDQMSELYTVTSFLAPFVGVVRKSDGAAGTLKFTLNPRMYFSFERS